MTPHLTDRDMELFANNHLPPADLLAADRHLRECGQCRASLSQLSGGEDRLQDLRKAFGSDPLGDHLTYEELAACADAATGLAIFPKAKLHLESCSECHNEVSQFVMLGEAEDSIRMPAASSLRPKFLAALRSFFHPRIAIAVSVLLLCIALVGWLALRKRNDTGPGEIAAGVDTNLESGNNDSIRNAVAETSVLANSNSSAPANAATGVAANPIRDNGENVGLDSAGRLVGYENLSPKHRQMLERSLRYQNVDIAPEIDELKQSSSAMMGDSDGATNSFAVDGPFGKVISTDQPTISWHILPGAENYSVEVYDSQFHKVLESGALRSTTWSPKLPRGRTYTLQVTAVKDGMEIKAPRRPAPEAKFHILNGQKLTEIESAKRAHPKANLLLGLLYAKYGMLDEAAERFRFMIKENPQSTTARRLLAKVQTTSPR